jgi:hypothetical protein
MAGRTEILPRGDDGQPTHSPDGVDLTLVRWMLGLTPTQRLEVLQQQIIALAELQRAAGAR